LAEKFDKFSGVGEATEKDRKKALLSLFQGGGGRERNKTCRKIRAFCYFLTIMKRVSANRKLR